MSRRPNHRQRGQRPTSPASSSSASASDDDDNTHLTLIGTPVDTTERHYRALRLQRQQQRGQTLDNFTPAVFVSSRQRRWQGEEATVEEYMDDKDVNEQKRDRLQVRADIEVGRRGDGDALQLAIAPRHETVARRILRRMGWKQGGGVGKTRRLASSKQTVTRVSRVRRRPTVSAALPPSMQALLDEDDNDSQIAVSNHRAPVNEETKDEHTDALDEEDEDEEDDAPLSSDVPLFQPSHKDDFFGLAFDPLLNAEEFAAHRTQQLQQRRRKEEEQARDAALMDDALDDVVELTGRAAGRAGRGGGRGGGGRVPGFRVMDDDEMDDDGVEVYEDRAEYDTHIGRLKGDKKQQERQEEQMDEGEVKRAGGYSELIFVKGEVGGIRGVEAAESWVVPRDWNERKVWDEAEEAMERERMKAVVREWADSRRAHLRATQDEARQQQRQIKDETKHEESKQQQLPFSRREPSSSAPSPPPVQSTADMLASGFFSRFTMGDTAALSPSSASLPMPPPPPNHAAAPVPFTLRQLKHEVLTWDPSPLLCRQLGVEPRPRREAATKPSTDRSTSRSNNSPHGKDKQHRRQRQQQMRDANEAAELQAAQLRAPVIAVDRPPKAVLSAIFDDVDDRGDEERARVAQQQWLETEAMRLLSSIILPGNGIAPTTAPVFTAGPSTSLHETEVNPSRLQQVPTPILSLLPGTASFDTALPSHASTTYPPASSPASVSAAVSGSVHPSRQHMVPTTQANTVATSAEPRRSRWGEKVEGLPPLPPALPPPTPQSPHSSPPPLGPPTPPSLKRNPPVPTEATSTAPAARLTMSEEQKAALKAELLRELAVLERQSEREKQARRSKREKQRERRGDRHRSRSSGRSDREKQERGHDRYLDKRHHRHVRDRGSSDDDSRSSDPSVRTASPRRVALHKADVVDLT